MNSTTTVDNAPPMTDFTSGTGLHLALHLPAGGAVLAREQITKLDFSDAATETWRECCLRKGRTEVALADFPARFVPIRSKSTPSRYTGYALEVAGPAGEKARCEFSISSLEPVARRAADRLLKSGVIQAGDEYVYELDVDPAGNTAAPAPGEDDSSLDADIVIPPLRFLEVPLRPLLDRARPENMAEDGVFPVFYTETARADAERFSRKGAVINPRFESGGVLVGPFCSCPETGEFFVVVTDVFEVMDAEQGIISLEYTSKSWSRIQAVIKARQSEHPAVRMLGQCHGHNYLPNNGEICAVCLQLPVCNASNLFPSEADKTWTSAVFAKQACRLCHIFGLTARGDLINGLYGLRDAQLLERGFRVIPNFNPDEYETKPAPQPKPH